MKIPLFERAFKHCSSSLVKFTQEMLRRMLLKRKVCSQLRFQKAVGAGKHLTTNSKQSPTYSKFVRPMLKKNNLGFSFSKIKVINVATSCSVAFAFVRGLK